MPGRVFERPYNAASIERAAAGAMLESFVPDALKAAVLHVSDNPAYAEASRFLHQTLASLGGASRIATSIVIS